ncbi:MAG: hypothetical protein R2722_15530 [Tessaracoccus sp.]
MPPPDPDAWRGLLGEALAGWQERGGGEAVAKLLYTRGLESRTTEPLRPVTITGSQRAADRRTKPHHRRDAVRRRAVDALNDAPWLLGGAKTLSYAGQSGLRQGSGAARGAGCHPGSTDGYVLEGPKSDHRPRGVHAARLLPRRPGSWSRSRCVSRSTAGSARGRSAYGPFTPEDLRTADAAWLASSVRGSRPSSR